MTGRYDYERCINFFRQIYTDDVDNYWFGFIYRLIDET